MPIGLCIRQLIFNIILNKLNRHDSYYRDFPITGAGGGAPVAAFCGGGGPGAQAFICPFG